MTNTLEVRNADDKKSFHIVLKSNIENKNQGKQIYKIEYE